MRPDTELAAVAELLRSPFDPVLVDGIRLRLQAALQGLPAGGSLSFTGLRRLLELTDGNLGMHLKVLVEAGYVEPTHSWRGRRRTTFYAPTAAGRAALERHVAALQAVISAAKAC
ncbi:MAG: transcriptional regulator [Candidatus Dormibacteraeota bacterium]|nr:transcriptional regulator [Candidatus Dormibacteraeota bacterium]